MDYVLEHKDEALRLEFQGKLENYRLDREMNDLHIQPGSRVLDAGCGSGLISRYLVDHFPGIDVTACDFSSQRIAQARELAGHSRYGAIRFETSDLQQLKFQSWSFDWVVCRFVFEHLGNPQAASDEFFRVLQNGGKIRLIDLDGILFNLHTRNAELSSMLAALQRGWKTDLFVGRKLPAMLKESGFGSIRWEMQPMQFHGESLQDERELTRQRLEFIRPTVLSILGSEALTDRFSELYCSEMLKPEATLFYNKFIVTAEKPTS